jgi:hypothetical protein
MPYSLAAAQFSLVLPMTSVENEGSFSAEFFIRQDCRIMLKQEHLIAAMRVFQSEFSSGTAPLEKAVKVFLQSKSRNTGM